MWRPPPFFSGSDIQELSWFLFPLFFPFQEHKGTLDKELQIWMISKSTYFSISLRVSGIFLSFVSGTKMVMAPEVMAMAAKMTVGMAGWMSARAATVVERVPPTLDTKEEEPTPAARTVVGINSPAGNSYTVQA